MLYNGTIFDHYITRAMMDYSDDSITAKEYELLCDGYGNGCYARVSKKKAANHGLTRAEMRGKNDYDFLSKEEADRARAVDIWVMTNKKQFIVPEERIVRNGKVIWYCVTVIPLIDPDGVVRGTICTSRDITKRVVAQQREKRLLRFMIRRIQLPMIALVPQINKLGPRQKCLANALNEMLIRLNNLLLIADK